jgi:hypothetical protein
MSTSGDELRPSAAQREEKARAAEREEAMRRVARDELIDQTRDQAAALALSVFRPLLEEFRQVMESAGVVHGAFVRMEGQARGGLGHGRQQFTFGGRSSKYSLRHFHVRLLAVPHDTGVIELSAECLQNGIPGPGSRTTWEPLVKLPTRNISLEESETDAAQEWCTDVLKRSAEALMEANFHAAHAAPAPLAAFPALPTIDMTVTT